MHASEPQPANAIAAHPDLQIARIAVLIPARRHEPELRPLLEALLSAGFGGVLLVDDGSPEEDKPLFDNLAKNPRVRLLRHAVNRGKGRALKTGIQHFLDAFPGFAGLVTADADGQHSVGDIVHVAQTMLAAAGRPVLGCRNFSGQVPLRNRFGNSLTRLIFRLVSGHALGDTQTGLRAFPAVLLPELAALPGERYEYEMTVLAYLCGHRHLPVEEPIATIYIDNNRSSSFKPVRDSIRIYSVLLRFFVLRLFRKT